MNDAAILKEIERRLVAWFGTGGWAEENSGYGNVLGWIEGLRDGTDDYEAEPKEDAEVN